MQVDYESMFTKQKKDTNPKERPLMKALKEEHAEDLLKEEKKFDILPEEEQNKLILGGA